MTEFNNEIYIWINEIRHIDGIPGGCASIVTRETVPIYVFKDNPTLTWGIPDFIKISNMQVPNLKATWTGEYITIGIEIILQIDVRETRHKRTPNSWVIQTLDQLLTWKDMELGRIRGLSQEDLNKFIENGEESAESIEKIRKDMGLSVLEFEVRDKTWPDDFFSSKIAYVRK